MEELDKILQKHISDPNSEFLQYEHDSIINAMKEVWNSAVDKCAETAEAIYSDDDNPVVERDSILKNKIQL